MRLTDNEKLELWGMRQSFASANVPLAVGEFTQGITDLLQMGEPESLYRALSGIERVKGFFQSMHNYAHTLGMLAAKSFLEKEFPAVPWENYEFAEDANRSGADLCINEHKIVAELKTTEPCGKSKGQTTPTRFGPQQKVNIDKDFQKLSAVRYVGFSKFMFVTSPLAYACLVRDYRAAFPDICFVLLSGLPEVSRPLPLQATTSRDPAPIRPTLRRSDGA